MMKKVFLNEINCGLERSAKQTPSIITESDLEHLPRVVAKYLRIVGVVGRERVFNMRVVMDGRIRSNPESGWMNLSSKQYNFFDDYTRVFYIKAAKMGVPAIGLHLYKREKATFTVKILGLFKIIDAKGEKLDQAETVTLFNDMCLIAPATLISDNIKWDEVDDYSVVAHFTNGKNKISAQLFFNENGDLINFISNDRYETDGKRYINYPWFTPVKNYGVFNGYKLPCEVSADYQRPDITYSYGEFRLKEVKYNL